MIDLKDAAQFLRVCETENLTRAALLSKVSPSTLSRTLTKLEKELNVKLCYRDQKGIVITKAGRLFERFAQDSLRNFALLQQSLAQEIAPLKGTLKIYCSVSASYIFIPRLLSELRLLHPELEISLETGDPANALDFLNHDGIDFVIAPKPKELNENIELVDLIAFPLAMIAPRNPAYPLNGLDYTNTLDNIPMVLPERGKLRTDIEDYFKTHKAKLNVLSQVAGHEAIVSMVALGFGLAIVPRIIVDLSPFKNDVIILDKKDLPDFDVALCHLKSRSGEPCIKAINDLAFNIAPSFAQDLRSRKLNNF